MFQTTSDFVQQTAHFSRLYINFSWVDVGLHEQPSTQSHLFPPFAA